MQLCGESVAYVCVGAGTAARETRAVCSDKSKSLCSETEDLSPRARPKREPPSASLQVLH